MLKAVFRVRRKALHQEYVGLSQPFQRRLQCFVLHFGDGANERIGKAAPDYRSDLCRLARRSEPVHSYEIFAAQDQDHWLRQLFAPTFIVWLTDAAPEKFAFELVGGTLCCYVNGHKKKAAELDSDPRRHRRGRPRLREERQSARGSCSRGSGRGRDVGVGDQRGGDHQQDRGDEHEGDDELDLRCRPGGALLDRAALVAAQGARPGGGAGRPAASRSGGSARSTRRGSRARCPGRARRSEPQGVRQRPPAVELGDRDPQLLGERPLPERAISSKPAAGPRPEPALTASRSSASGRAASSRRGAGVPPLEQRSGVRKPASGSPIATRSESPARRRRRGEQARARPPPARGRAWPREPPSASNRWPRGSPAASRSGKPQPQRRPRRTTAEASNGSRRQASKPATTRPAALARRAPPNSDRDVATSNRGRRSPGHPREPPDRDEPDQLEAAASASKRRPAASQQLDEEAGLDQLGEQHGSPLGIATTSRPVKRACAVAARASSA